MSKNYMQFEHKANTDSLAGSTLTMINRHSPFYIKAVQQGKVFRSSNRNQVLLGQEDSVYNTSMIVDDKTSSIMCLLEKQLLGSLQQHRESCLGNQSDLVNYGSSSVSQSTKPVAATLNINDSIEMSEEDSARDSARDSVRDSARDSARDDSLKKQSTSLSRNSALKIN